MDIGTPILIEDGENNKYAVDSKGIINKVPENIVSSGVGNAIPGISTTANVNIPKISFSSHNSQLYGFDSLQQNTLSNYYNTIEINGNNVFLPWKSIKQNTTDIVNIKNFKCKQ